MARLEEVIFDRLTSDHAGTSALIGTRCYPMVKPQGQQLACVVYQKVSGVRVVGGGSDFGLAHPRFQFRCIAPSYSEVKTLAIQVTAALSRWGRDTTNLATRSEQLDNVVWTKSFCTISADATTAPDGTSTADKIVEDTSTNRHNVAQLKTGLTSAVPHTASVYVGRSDRDWFTMTEGNNVTARAFFNISTGVVGTVSGTGSPSATIEVLEGWFRCSLTFTPLGTVANVQFGPTTADGVASYLGDGASGCFVWGAQFEEGPFNSSYIKTVGSTVTRETIHSFPLNEFDGPTEPNDDGKGKLHSVLMDYEIWHHE